MTMESPILRPMKSGSGSWCSTLLWAAGLVLVLTLGATTSFALEEPDDVVAYVSKICGAIDEPDEAQMELEGDWFVILDGSARGKAITWEEDGYMVELVEVPADTLKYVNVTADGSSRWTDGKSCWTMEAAGDCETAHCLQRASGKSGPRFVAYMRDESDAPPETSDTNCTLENAICGSSGACCGGLIEMTAEEKKEGSRRTSQVCRCKKSS